VLFAGPKERLQLLCGWERESVAVFLEGKSASQAKIRNLTVLSFPFVEHVPQSLLEHDFGRRLARPVQPILEVLNFDNVGHLGLPRPNRCSCQPSADLGYPRLCAQKGKRLGHGFVEASCRDIDRMSCILEILDDNRASPERHKEIYHIRYLFAFVVQ
jgi:hypothetical protein